MAGILERLELERPTIVTSESLSQILQEEGISIPVRIAASRFREKGWFLSTPKRRFAT
jgi:DNA-binding transcriptional regulator PaaX